MSTQNIESAWAADSRQLRFRRGTNYFCLGLLWLIGCLLITPLLLIFSYLVSKGLPAIDWAFFTQLPKPAGELGGGLANGMVGSLKVVLIASLIGIPWGLAAGIFLSEYGDGKTVACLRWTADLLASLPSILVGLFVYALMVSPVLPGIPFKGFSAYAGGVALAIIMIPVVIRTSEEMLKLIPNHLREAGLALGLPRWKVILRIVLPAARTGVTTGVILALARVAGETAPLLFTAFGNQYWSKSLSEPTATLPVLIYNYAISPYADWHRQAWAGALVLVVFVFVLNVMTRFVLAQKKASLD